MNITKFCLIILCFGFFVQFGNSQDQGTVEFRVKLEGPVPEHMAILDGATLKIIYKGERRYTETQMKQMKTIVVESPDETLVLIDRMGQKTMIRNKNKTDDDSYESEKDEDAYDISYTNETKTILGYPCKKAILKLRNANDENDIEYEEVWYTEKLPNFMLIGKGLGEGLESADVKYKDLKGCPLEFKLVRKDGTIMTISVTKLSFDPVADDVFNVSTEGYQEMNLFGE